MSVTPPRPKGPPLNALRAFEAAARLGGFRLASAELNVTPGAIAQHVKFLEAWCGGLLFERLPVGVQLTPLGTSILPDFVAAFDALAAASHKLRMNAAPNRVSVTALPSIAQLWLGPLLPKIREELPGISISVTAMEAPPNLAREPFDLSIFFSSEADKSADLQLPQDELVPVCSPEIARRISTLADLQDLSCLSDQMWPGDWTEWLKSIDPRAGYSVSGPSYSLYGLAVNEALNGAGVLIGHLSLVNRYLLTGELVAPFPQRAKTAHRLTIYRSAQARSKIIRRLLDILKRFAKNL
ncbi:MAG: LysR family transcriptional regulator [Rhodobacteraceae bacterium]|nr:LysR family transcriptional regulator [Paracoccaceae bacterium]